MDSMEPEERKAAQKAPHQSINTGAPGDIRIAGRDYIEVNIHAGRGAEAVLDLNEKHGALPLNAEQSAALRAQVMEIIDAWVPREAAAVD